MQTWVCKQPNCQFYSLLAVPIGLGRCKKQFSFNHSGWFAIKASHIWLLASSSDNSFRSVLEAWSFWQLTTPQHMMFLVVLKALNMLPKHTYPCIYRMNPRSLTKVNWVKHCIHTLLDSEAGHRGLWNEVCMLISILGALILRRIQSNLVTTRLSRTSTLCLLIKGWGSAFQRA